MNRLDQRRNRWKNEVRDDGRVIEDRQRDGCLCFAGTFRLRGWLPLFGEVNRSIRGNGEFSR